MAQPAFNRMLKLYCFFPTALCVLLAGGSAPAAEDAPSIHPLGNQYRLNVSAPVVVSMAAPGEHRWGRHQFVSLSAYPGNKLLLRFHAGDDSVTAYGSGQPTFISSDQGRTWTAFKFKGFPGSGLVCAVMGGESLCLPMPKPLDVRAQRLDLPPPAGEFFCYRKMLLYRADQCPTPVREFLRCQPCCRWDPRVGKWLPDETAWDMQGRLVWIAQGAEAGLVSGITFERAPIRLGKELLCADYRASYLLPDGTAPKGCGVSCMVSTNNGKSWQRRAVIANADAIAGEISNLTEPVLGQTADGTLLCVIRRTDQQQKSMLITFSRDLGKNWEPPRPLDQLGRFGVMPDLLRLECGPLVLSYGRPGVHLAFSLDGSGKTWEAPLCLLPGDARNVAAKTDGYTALMAVGASELLVGYSDFERPDDQGRRRKAILVRRLSLERTR